MTHINTPTHSHTASAVVAQLALAAPTYDWAVLVLGAYTSSVARQGMCGGEVALDWGYASVAEQCLRHAVVNDAEVEHAIAMAEDRIMPLARPWPHPAAASTLACAGDATREWQAHLDDGKGDVADWHLYTTEAVEVLFNRFADIAMGGPARGLALSAHAVASLIIVRECLHHWGMQTLALPSH